jgi:hypothetical protein
MNIFDILKRYFNLVTPAMKASREVASVCILETCVILTVATLDTRLPAMRFATVPSQFQHYELGTVR